MRTHSTQAAFIRKLPIRYVYIEIGLREMQHATRDEKKKRIHFKSKCARVNVPDLPHSSFVILVALHNFSNSDFSSIHGERSPCIIQLS